MQDHEPELTWRKSSFSMASCVEVASVGAGLVAVRDSKNPNLPPQVYDKAEWDAFLKAVKAGEFDDIS